MNSIFRVSFRGVRLVGPRFLLAVLLSGSSACIQSYMVTQVLDPGLVSVRDRDGNEILSQGRTASRRLLTRSESSWRGFTSETYIERRSDGSIVTLRTENPDGSPVTPPEEKVLVTADGVVDTCDLNRSECLSDPLSGVFLQGGYDSIHYSNRGTVPLWISTSKENVLCVVRRYLSLFASWPQIGSPSTRCGTDAVQK
jgi:hypothetical protein